MKRSIRYMCMILMCLVGSTACINFKARPVKKSFYRIEIQHGDKAGPLLAPDSTLKVVRARISPSYESTEFIYRINDLNYEFDFYNQFHTPPDRIITWEVIDWLRDANLFERVTDAGSRVEATHVLEPVVNELYGDFRDPNRPMARLEMQFFLSHEADGKSDVIFEQRYKIAEPIASRSPSALAEGYQRAFSAIMTRLEQDLPAGSKI